MRRSLRKGVRSARTLRDIALNLAAIREGLSRFLGRRTRRPIATSSTPPSMAPNVP